MKLPKAGFGLIAALLFGLSTPLAKLAIRDIDALLLAGLLYLGSGVGLALVIAGRKIAGFQNSLVTEGKKHEMRYLTGAIIFGGLLAPVLLMAGLSRTDASTSSLLLNLEGALTALLACVAFQERYGKRLVIGLGFILGGGGILAWGHENAFSGNWAGVLLIAGACCGWAIDNNFTKQVNSMDATSLAALKGLVSGLVNVSLALLIGQRLPGPGRVAGAAAIGFVGYGLSLVCFILSLRSIGTARTSAYFSTAPFVGAAASLVLLRERLGWAMLAAGLLMAVGVYLHLTEKPPLNKEA